MYSLNGIASKRPGRVCAFVRLTFAQAGWTLSSPALNFHVSARWAVVGSRPEGPFTR